MLSRFVRAAGAQSGDVLTCEKEMKIQRRALDRNIALPGPFDAFFSFPQSKGGYSGVAIYTNSRVVLPQKAEEGLTGTIQPKVPLSPEERISSRYPIIDDLKLLPNTEGEYPSTLLSLDNEGRALVVPGRYPQRHIRVVDRRASRVGRVVAVVVVHV